MTFLPIVERELRVAARRPGTYWTRLGVAVAALVVGGWIMLVPFFQSAQRLGIALFVAMSILAYAYCLLAGLRTTADCLSEEKRDGTLGLLFLTDLKGYDIVFGKLAATSLNVFYGILSIFPIMAISLLVGGVAGGEFGRVMLVSINNLFFSLAVGMFASAISRDERKAAVLALLILLVLTGGLPLAGGLIAEYQRLPRPNPLFFIPSPGYACVLAFDEPFRRMASFNYFYWSVLCVHLMAWAGLITACLVVPRTWQDKAESVSTVKRRAFWQRLAHGSADTRRRIRTRLLEINPVYWLTGRDRFKALLVWMPLAAGGLLWLWGLLKYPSDWKEEEAYVWTALLAHTLLKCWIGSEACRRFALDRRSGALELILSAPLRVREIISGQMLALRKQFLGPCLVVLAVDFIFLLAERNDPDWTWLWVAGISMFIADMLALPWVGMWTGLNSRNVNRAAGAALARIMVLPWVVWGVLMTGMALLLATGGFARGLPDWVEYVPLASWVIIGFAVAIGFGLASRASLLARFREVATRRFDPPRLGFWRARRAADPVAPPR